jgi:hypothetical protein
MRGQFKSTVGYDPDLGFPVSADLDPAEHVFDDELKLRVIDFRLVSERR